MQPINTLRINGVLIRRNFLLNLPYNPHLISRAKAFRKRGVISEVIFWMEVNKRKFHSLDFDRQKIIGNYIVDFYCKSLALAIEIDGSSHNDKEVYDQIREDYLRSLGVNIYRISDLRVKHDLDNVLVELTTYIITEYRDSPPAEGCP